MTTNLTFISSALSFQVHSSHSSFLPHCVKRNRNLQSPPKLRPLWKASASSPSEGYSEQLDKDQEQLLKTKPPKSTKWAEIPFTSIEEELAAIEEYEQSEKPAENDPWPKFLRGSAYEYWGFPQLALAQYAKTNSATGLKRVPQLWDKRAYNAFKLGNVRAAHAYYEISTGLLNESTGNELHFSHWFDRHFKDYMPKWNGPPAPLQRGIAKYCVGFPKEACYSFVPQIFAGETDVAHSLLWFLASCGKLQKEDDALKEKDMKVVDYVLESDRDWDPRLLILIKLYYAAAKKTYTEVSEAETELSDAIKSDKSDDITTYVYLALYHDAFTGEKEEMDSALDIVCAIGSPKSHNDTENFLFHAAKNRLTMPQIEPNASNTGPTVSSG